MTRCWEGQGGLSCVHGREDGFEEGCTRGEEVRRREVNGQEGEQRWVEDLERRTDGKLLCRAGEGDSSAALSLFWRGKKSEGGGNRR